MNYFEIKDKRRNHLLSITSSLDIKINVYIDGNNLYRNLSDEIKDILEIYKLAADTYYLKKEVEMDELEKYEEDMMGYQDDLTKIDYTNTPEKLANLASWYVKNSLPDAIIRNVKASNAKNLLGELDTKNNEIKFPGEAWSAINTLDGSWLGDLLINDFFGIDTIRKEKITKKAFYTINRILNSIDEYKSITFKDAESLHNFFKENKRASISYYKKLESWGLEDFKNKILLNFKTKYYLYRAKVDIEKYISICKNRLSIPSLSSTQKNFYFENINLLKQNKFKPNIKKDFVININEINLYYKNLEKDLSAEVNYGYCSWNSFKISEKEVDSKINIDLHKAMLTNKADLFCLLTNDSDFTPLFEEAKKLNKELFLCSVVPRKTISKRLKDVIPQKNIFSVKNLDFESMYTKILGATPPIDFKEFITNEKFREETYNKIYEIIMEQQYYLTEIKNNFRKLKNQINFLFKEKFE